jgi:phage/plasmid-associated DNA primase
LSKFIGKENVSNLSLHRIGIGKSFDLLNLKDKYSNIHDDLSSRDLVDIGGFKMATGSSTISGEVKFGDTITFTSFAKQTFAANKIPPITDIDEDAYYEKWIPIACDNKIPKSEQDKNLIQKLTTEAELSGLFNWAIEGLYRLIKNNGFSFDKSPTEVKEIMMRSGHHLSAFAQDCLEKEDGHKISKDNMFVYYTCWCEKNHKARMSKEQLGRQLERFVPYILASRGKERYWNNVRLKLSIYDTYDTFLKSYKEYKNKDKDNLNVYIFSEKETQVSQNKEEFTLLPESKQDVGRCSYCGKISLLKYKDDKGNYACSYCADKEENNV